MPATLPDFGTETTPEPQNLPDFGNAGGKLPDFAEPITKPLKLDALETAEFEYPEVDKALGQNDKNFLTAVANNPRGFIKSIPGDIGSVTGALGKLPYAAAADVTSKLFNDLEYGHNLAQLETGSEEPLPVDKFLGAVSKSNPALATIGKIGEGVAQVAPMIGIGGLPAAAQKLVVRGFTADMLYHAPGTAKDLYTELQKPADKRDMDKVTSLISDGAQQVIFGGMGAAAEAKLALPELQRAVISKYVPKGIGIEAQQQPYTGLALNTPTGAKPATHQPEELQPALMVNGKPVTGADTHAQIPATVADSGLKAETAKALLDDKNHVFVDKQGKVFTRQQAAQALGLPKPLQSEQLKELQLAKLPPGQRMARESVEAMAELRKQKAESQSGLTSAATRAGQRPHLAGRPDGVPDVLDAIQEEGGIRPPGSTAGGEYDGYSEAMKGPAQLLRNSASRHGPDTMIQALQHRGFENIKTPDDLWQAVKGASRERVKLPLRMAAQEILIRKRQREYEAFTKSLKAQSPKSGVKDTSEIWSGATKIADLKQDKNGNALVVPTQEGMNLPPEYQEHVLHKFSKWAPGQAKILPVMTQGRIEGMGSRPRSALTKIVGEDKPGLYGSRYIRAIIDGHPWKIRIADHDPGQSSAEPLVEVAKANKRQLLKAATIPNEEPFTVNWLTDEPSKVTFDDVVKAVRANVADEFYTHEDSKYGGALDVYQGWKDHPDEIEVENGYQKEKALESGASGIPPSTEAPGISTGKPGKSESRMVKSEDNKSQSGGTVKGRVIPYQKKQVFEAQRRQKPKQAGGALASEERNLRELTGFVQQPFERETELNTARQKLAELTGQLEAEGKASPPATPGETPAEGETESNAMLASGAAAPAGPVKRALQATGRKVVETPAAVSFMQDIDTVRRALAPHTFGQQAQFTANVLRELGAQRANEEARAAQALRRFRNSFDRTPVPKNWKYDPGLPLPRNYAFIDVYEGGRSQLDPDEQKAAEEFHRQNDALVDQVHALGVGALQTFYENYFAHIWENPIKARNVIAQSLAKRPFEGSRAFLKQRTYQLFREGLAAGLKPVHDNPVDLWLLKRREVGKLIDASKFLKMAREADIPQFVHAFSKAPLGYKKVEDPAFTEYAPPFVEVKEAFDAGVQEKIKEVLDKLAIGGRRVVKLGRKGWGYEQHLKKQPGTERIVTKFGGPQFVWFHELGHALDSRYPDLRKALLGNDTMKDELTALAKLRYAGEEDQVTPRHKKYVQTTPEKMATVLQAYLHAPELFEQTAPTVRTAWLKFMAEHPELKAIDEIRPTLRLAEASAKYPVGGLVKLGDWYFPEGAAYVLNNYLKPGLAHWSWYKGLKEASNLLNGVQLVGGFHLGFVTGEAPINKLALAAKDASLGHVTLAGKALLSAPFAPFVNLRKGYLLQKESLHPGSVGGLYEEAVKNLEAGGFRFSQDPYWRTHFTRRAVRAMAQAWTQLQEPGVVAKGYALTETGRALINLPWTIVEQVMRPVMEYFVPWQKAGAAMEMLGHDLITQNPQDAAQLREVARKVSDSIDNRMGQMTYDNTYLNKMVKDSMLLGFRSFGWQLGKYREAGGGALDLAKLGYNAAQGKWTGLSHRSAYIMTLPLGVALFGGMLNYMMTGQLPQNWQDYYMPRTGRKDDQGNDVRISLPSYMKDVISYGRHPGLALEHSLNPFLSDLADLWNNRDFYNVEIRTPDETTLQKFWSDVKYVAGQGRPFFLTGMQKLAESGTPIEQQAAAFFGFMPASKQSRMTAAETMASELMQDQLPAGARTPDEAARSQLMGNLVHDIRAGKFNDDGELHAQERAAGIDKKTRAGKEKLHDLHKRVFWTPLQYQISKLPLVRPGGGDVMTVWKLMNDTERRQTAPVILDKIKSARKAKSIEQAEALELAGQIGPYLVPATQPQAAGTTKNQFKGFQP